MLTIRERMDWMWFLGFDREDGVPNQSVLSKARSRRGVAAFRRFFERIVGQCVEAGLVDGSKLFVDASLLEADASNNSVVDRERLSVREVQITPHSPRCPSGIRLHGQKQEDRFPDECSDR